jgi:SSS family solute:Na+ symporter
MGWWGNLTNIVSLVASIAGFVIYRYRQTRALTLAQFFEMRYSRRFRLFAGILGFSAGVVNYGVIPVIGARFFVYFLDLPLTVHLFVWTIPTYLLLMGLSLTISTLMTTAGGQITVLATNCAEGMFSLVFYVIVAAVLIATFNWHGAREALLDTRPHESMVNPFDSYRVENFNTAFVFMGLAIGLYSTMAWQNSHAFNASAISPHESRMGNILNGWRGFAGAAMGTLFSLSLLVYLRHPPAAFISQADALLSLIPLDQYEAKDQAWISVAMAHMLPVGVKGMVCSIWLMGLFALDEMHLHSWSSIFVQDILLPLRKTPMTSRQHLAAFRIAIISVAAFAFVFGSIYSQTQNIQLWFAITQAIFTGGAGAAIIGGLYWDRGTTAGAWTGMIVGTVLSAGGILLQQSFWNHIDLHRWSFLQAAPGIGHPFAIEWLQDLLSHHLGPKIRLSDGSYTGFPFHAVEVSFFATLAAMASYILVSLLTCRQPHNMDRLLHRGRYAVEPEGGEPSTNPPGRFSLLGLIGIDEHFSRRDRWLTCGIFGWNMLWMLIVTLGSAIYLVHPWSNDGWVTFWFAANIGLSLVIGAGVSVWFTIGCTGEMIRFFRLLKQERVDPRDDGTVFVHPRPN